MGQKNRSMIPKHLKARKCAGAEATRQALSYSSMVYLINKPVQYDTISFSLGYAERAKKARQAKIALA